MSNPSTPVRVMVVGTTFGVKPPMCDPAINLDACTSAVLTRYERERSDEARAAIPLHPGAQPVLFEVRPLSSGAYRWVQRGENYDERAQRAFRLCCHRYTDDHGTAIDAATYGGVVEASKGVNEAAQEWLDHVHDTFGALTIREVASVAMMRAEAGPRALAPFKLPPGLMLPL